MSNLEELNARYEQLKSRQLKLDLTRGKPSPEQLDLNNALDGILQGDYHTEGTDLRNYGGLDGLKQAKQLGSFLLDVPAENVLAGGNSSLTLMYHMVLHAMFFGVRGTDSAWSKQTPVKFLCPVPGYDRHFAICEEMGIEMLSVSMDDDGPIMEEVERRVQDDPHIKGMWCVPKYSNPSGCVYSDEVVTRLAQLGNKASPHFRILYDNAYAVHDLTDRPPTLANIFQLCQQYGTEDSVVQFGSTSKITFAGAGVAFMATSKANLDAFKQHWSVVGIGPDKINQFRHVKYLPDKDALAALMQQHANLLKPKFDAVLKVLQEQLGNRNLVRWNQPEGGYFISVYTQPGLASETVRLAKELGVQLTPAGAAYPYGDDPQDQHIRIAPSCPSVAEIEQAMDVFTLCVQLAAAQQQAG